MNYFEKHLGDFIKDTVGLSMIEEGAYNRLLDQLYVTEKPLPRSEIYKLARCTSVAERKAVDYVIQKYFRLVEGGFVQQRAMETITEFVDRPVKDAKQSIRERQRRLRERRSAMFDELRSFGVVPVYNTKTDELSRLLSQKKRDMERDKRDIKRDMERDKERDITREITRDVTANHSPLPTSHFPEEKQCSVDTPHRLLSPGDVSKLLRAHGVQCQPGEPQIIEFSKQGVSAETLEAAAIEAKADRERTGQHTRITSRFIASILARWFDDAARTKVPISLPPRKESIHAARQRTLDGLTGRSEERDDGQTIDV